MSTELPDTTTHSVWRSRFGWFASSEHIEAMGREWASLYAPWTPLDTPEGHIKRIDRDKLAGVIQSVLDRWFDGYSGGHGVIADAVLAALPELMGDTTKEEA